MNTENSQTSEPHKFSFNLSQILDLRSSSKHAALQNLSIYYTSQDIRKHYKNNKLKIIAPTWNDEFELPDGSYYVSDIQDYIEYIIKTWKINRQSSCSCYINRIYHRLTFKMKDESKLELQTPELMKLFSSTKK